MQRLVLLRHGESVWNYANRFTGWTDVALTDRGVQEAIDAGRCLRQEGYVFDLAYTSVLKRAIKTLWLVLEEMDLMWIPVSRSWRLNERHYGALQGCNKAETAARHGREQTLRWRRSHDVRPPALRPTDPRYAGKDPRYAALRPAELPLTESLKDTVARFVPYWHATIAPALWAGKRPLIVAHGNSLRALVTYLDALQAPDIVGLTIPTGVPLVYELDDALTPMRRFYLGDPQPPPMPESMGRTSGVRIARETARHRTGETPMKSDALITHEVLCELKWDTHVDDTEVMVEVDRGTVTLTGTVGHYGKKSRRAGGDTPRRRRA